MMDLESANAVMTLVGLTIKVGSLENAIEIVKRRDSEGKDTVLLSAGAESMDYTPIVVATLTTLIEKTIHSDC